MEKMIVITMANFIGSNKPMEIIERTSPEIDKLLEDGYKIKQSIPVFQQETKIFSVIFILEK